MSDDVFSKRDLLRLGARRASEAGAVAIELAFESFADRLTPHVQRPPGALSEVSFLLACTRCNRCADACPPGAILVLDDTAGIAAGTPYLNVNEHKPCVACSHMPCIPACADGALVRTALQDVVMGTATLDRGSCLAWNDQDCSRCVEACPVSETAMLQDEAGRVYIDPRHCIGCGMCRAVCPTDPKSISVRPPPRI